MTEAEIQRRVINVCLKLGWGVIRVNGLKVRRGDTYISSYMLYPSGDTEGLADLLAVRDGMIVALENKRLKGRQEKSQKRFEAWCNHHNIPYHICRDEKAAQQILEEQMMRRRPTSDGAPTIAADKCKSAAGV